MRILVLILCLGVISPLSAQLGIKGGFYTVQLNPQDLSIFNPNTLREFTFGVKDTRFGFHIGAMYKIRMDKFFLQPELVLNSNTTTFTFKDLNVEKQLEESYQYLDLPLMAGFDLGVLNLFAGPVGHWFIGSTSEFNDEFGEGYRQRWQDITLGWQAGLSFDIGRFNIDLRYEGNFYRFGEHMVFFGDKYNFQDRPSRVITSIGFMFGS
jgi:hypothetical protein